VIVDPSDSKGHGLNEQIFDLLAAGRVLTRSSLRESLAVKNERLGEVLESFERAASVVRTSAGWQHCR
jgi:hypothetical protein